MKKHEVCLKSQARALAISGHTWTEIATRLGKHPSTIRHWAKKGGFRKCDLQAASTSQEFTPDQLNQHILALSIAIDTAIRNENFEDAHTNRREHAKLLQLKKAWEMAHADLEAEFSTNKTLTIAQRSDALRAHIFGKRSVQ